jgi:hypothetical protein
MKREHATTQTITKLGIRFEGYFDMVTDDDGDSWLALSDEYINFRKGIIPPRVASLLYHMAEGEMQDRYESRDFR